MSNDYFGGEEEWCLKINMKRITNIILMLFIYN